MALALVALLIGACRSSAQLTGTSAVTGSVLLGPHCPVERVGSPCPDTPVPNARVVARDPSGDTVASTTCDAHGRFTLSLDPGTYELTATAHVGITGVSKPVAVTVTAGATSYANVEIDTGIR